MTKKQKGEVVTTKALYTDEAVGQDLVSAFRKAFSNKEIFFQFLDMFPYVLEIFAPDGTSVFINKAACEEMNIADPKECAGHFNLIRDPISNDVCGLRSFIEQAFRGETISVSDVRVPFEDTGTRYTKLDENFSEVKFQEILSFPIWDENQQLAYIVMVFQTKNTFRGKSEIIKAREYMSGHWLDEFDIDKIAEASTLSTYHFSRIFKQQTNETPFDFYKQIKVKKLKEKLRDPNLSVTQAFAACGVDYNGNYAKIFKEITGMTPSKYREEKFRTKV